jgi:D-3-phosphoglycerate dehydrogenase
MSSPIAIPARDNAAVAASASPASSYSSPQIKVKVLHPVENVDLRLLLLENISQDAVAAFRAQGFHVDHHTKAMSEDELIATLPDYHAIGIRSKTKITARVIKAAAKVGSRVSGMGF